MALAVTRLKAAFIPRDGLRISVLEGASAAVQATFTSGVVLTGFALSLGAGPWALGLLAAIPALFQFFQLVAAWALGRFGHRKAICVWGASVSRYLWLPIAFTPFLPLPAEGKLALFFTLLAIATALGQMAGIAWSDWMADAVPAGIRGRYFGLRNAVGALAGMVALYFGTRFLEGFGADQARGFFVLLMVAVAAGALCHALLAWQPEPPAAPRQVRHGLATLRAPLKDAPFRRLLGVTAGWMFCVNLTAPFTYAYALQHLKIGYGDLGLHALIFTALSVVFQPLWGKLIDRWGAQRVLVVIVLPTSLHPLYWLAMTPTFTLPFWLDAISTGIFWSGFMLATSALLMEASPPGERAGYMGLWNTLMGVATSMAALAAGAVLSVLGERVFALGPFHLGALQLVCLVGFGLRMVGFWMLAQVPRVAGPTVTIETWVAPALPQADGASPVPTSTGL
ncbi:MAG: MFS transporter [Candidatus Sericytochromatia bacterium]